MMYLLSVGANLILKHFAIKRANEMIKDDDNKMKSNDVIFNVLAFVPIVNTILAGIFGIALIVNDETLDSYPLMSLLSTFLRLYLLTLTPLVSKYILASTSYR